MAFIFSYVCEFKEQPINILSTVFLVMTDNLFFPLLEFYFIEFIKNFGVKW